MRRGHAEAAGEDEVSIIGYIFWFVVWLIFSAITAAGLNRDMQYCWGDEVSLARRSYRSDLALSIGCAIIPATWLIGPFITGFYEHGFGFSQRPDTAPK